jgi:hypothetical protein
MRLNHFTNSHSANFLRGQRDLMGELETWKKPLDSISAQIEVISDTTKQNLSVAVDTNAKVDIIISRKFLIPSNRT